MLAETELLTRFVEHRDQQAFTLLIERHLRWLYPAALRMVRDPGRAQDVTQAVFILLAQKAGTMRRDLPLSPWLFRVLQFTVRSLRRAERRRAGHEAMAGKTPPPISEDTAWLEQREVIDKAVARLSSADRQVILLRFYENQSLDAIGNALRTSEEAAKKRVARALARLREQFRYLGITGAALVIAPDILPTHLAASVPGVSAAAIAANAIGAATVVPAYSVLLAKGATHMMTFAKIKLAAAVVSASAILIAGGVAIYATGTSSAPISASAPVTTHSGVMDFRIAVLPAEIGTDTAAADSLQANGPEKSININNTTARWFEIDPACQDQLANGNIVIAARDGRSYVLCYDDHDHTLTHADPLRKPWRVTANAPRSDAGGDVTLPFNLDAIGGGYLGDLTSRNIRHPMAILLDNKALAAPTIQSQINDAGMLTFGAPTPAHTAADLLKEAQRIQQALNTGTTTKP